MNPSTWYCRLCAGLELRAKLVNLQTDEELCQEVIKKLSRFHITMDFQNNILPKTVCLTCIKSLDHAFKFICAVDEAQGFLSDFVMVKCSESYLEDNTVSYKLVGTDNCAPQTLENAQDPMEISAEDCNSNDQVKCENDSGDDCIKYNIKEEFESEGFESLVIDTCNIINHTVTEPVDIKPNILMNNVAEDNFSSTMNKTTKHEDITNHVVHVISQYEKPDIKTSKMLENQKNTTKKKKTKEIKVKTPLKKTTEAKSIPNTRNYSENEVNELIKNLSYVPEQYITKTWQDYVWHCCQCGTQFTNLEDLQKHSMEFHNSCCSYKCADCSSRTSNLKIFMNHVQGHHHKYLRYSCYKCYKIFPNPADIYKHRNETHKRRNMCKGCYKNFPTKELLKEHSDKYYKKLVDLKKYKNLRIDNSVCRICHKTFKYYNSYKTHFINQHMEESLCKNMCEICGKSFKYKGNLVIHVAGHQNQNKFQCDICVRHFKSRHGLRYHKNACHNMDNNTGNNTSFICDICGKCFKDKWKINAHMILHTDKMPYPCTMCDKKFRSRANLKNHMVQHSGAKPFSCTICFKEFANLSNRNKHVRRKHGIELAKKKRQALEINKIKVTEAENIED